MSTKIAAPTVTRVSVRSPGRAVADLAFQADNPAQYEGGDEAGERVDERVGLQKVGRDTRVDLRLLKSARTRGGLRRRRG
jgi:hypothetical protein